MRKYITKTQEEWKLNKKWNNKCKINIIHKNLKIIIIQKILINEVIFYKGFNGRGNKGIASVKKRFRIDKTRSTSQEFEFRNRPLTIKNSCTRYFKSFTSTSLKFRSGPHPRSMYKKCLMTFGGLVRYVQTHRSP